MLISYQVRRQFGIFHKVFETLGEDFPNHRAAVEGGCYLFNSSVSLPPTSCRAITADYSPLRIASSWTQTRNLWFLRESR